MANSKLAFGLVGTGYSKGWVGSISITGSKTNVAVDYIDTSGDMTTDPRVLPISVTGTLRTLVNSSAAAVHASVTKMAKRLARPEDLERKGK